MSKEMKEIKYYDITNRTKFYVDIKWCEKIEELTDSFMTNENLEIFTGEDNWQEWNTRCYDGAAIKANLRAWIAMMKPGAQSLRTFNRDIKEMLNIVGSHTLNHYVERPYRVGGYRLYNDDIISNDKIRKIEIDMEAQEREVKRILDLPYERQIGLCQKDLTNFSRALEKAIKTKYALTKLNLPDNTYNSHELLIFAKRLISWPELKRYIKEILPARQYLQDAAVLKNMWDDSSALNKLIGTK